MDVGGSSTARFAHEAADMTDQSTAGPRVLFVLSNDYGELFNAMYFIAGTSLQPVFLMPAKLFTVNQKGFPFRAYSYATVDDIVAALEKEQPDLTLLFSGYLYVINKLLDLPSVEKLIAYCRDHHLRVVTSDPTLGIVSHLADDTFDARNPRHEWLRSHVPGIYRLLKEIVHVYLAPTIATPVRYVSFFNANIVLDEAARKKCMTKLQTWSRIRRDKPQWFFVFSSEDLGIQTAIWGRDKFLALLWRKLRDAAENGRQPVLLAPQACLAEMEARNPRIDDLIMLASCNYGLFMFLLYTAEYTFYWNLFSASILARIVNRMPFFSFDKGHLAHVIKPLLEVGSKHFYPGTRLELLDDGRPLTIEGLRTRALRQEADVFDPVYKNLAKSPGPEQVVRDILKT